MWSAVGMPKVCITAFACTFFALEVSEVGVRTDHGDTRGSESVRNPCHQRRLGPDHHEIDRQFRDEMEHSIWIGDGDRMIRPDERSASIPWGEVQDHWAP